MEGGHVKILASGRGWAGFFLASGRGGGFYFRRRIVQISGPQAVNSEPSLRKRYPALPEQLKNKQIDVLVQIINRKNTFGILLTGFRKSLIYSISALIMDMVI